MLLKIPETSKEEGCRHARFLYDLLGHELSGLTELRALGDQGPWLAYVDNAKSFVALAMERNQRGDNIYTGLQPRPLDPFGKFLDKWQPARGGLHGNVAKASDIEFVMNMALDIDVATPGRSRGHPASNEELSVCAELATRMSKAEGFAGTAAVALSGNGACVINPITPVPVESDTATALKLLERRWIEQAGALPTGVRIDPIMDLPRIIRVIGTVNFKGHPTEGRPHRRSCFLTLPAIGGRQNLIAEQLRHMPVPSCRVAPRAQHHDARLLRGDLHRFEACSFVQWVYREAPSIPEPAWMDFLMQCAWLEGGDALAHRLSKRDGQRYSYEETQARLERIRRSGYRPKRCQHLSGQAATFKCPRDGECRARHPIDLALQHGSRSCIKR